MYLDDIEDGEEILDVVKDEYDEAKLEQYVDDDTTGGDFKVLSIRSVSGSAERSSFMVQVVTDKKLNKEQIDSIKEYLEGQNSDGFGEGLEQHAMDNYYVHLWDSRGQGTIFAGDQSEVIPSKFSKDTERIKSINKEKIKSSIAKGKKNMAKYNPANYKFKIERKK